MSPWMQKISYLKGTLPASGGLRTPLSPEIENWGWETWINKPCLHCSVVTDSLWPHGLWSAGSSVHEIFQARILERVAISFSRGYSWSRDWTQVSCVTGWLGTNKPWYSVNLLHETKFFFFLESAIIKHPNPKFFALLTLHKFMFLCLKSIKADCFGHFSAPVLWHLLVYKFN